MQWNYVFEKVTQKTLYLKKLPFIFTKESILAMNGLFSEWINQYLAKNEIKVRKYIPVKQIFFNDICVPCAVLDMEDTEINETRLLPLRISKSSLETDNWIVNYSVVR